MEVLSAQTFYRVGFKGAKYPGFGFKGVRIVYGLF